jgi:hypothetical protein
VVPEVDFGEALDMTPVERMERAAEDLRAIHRKRGYKDELNGRPYIPPRGGSEEEIRELEASLEFYLSDEYKEFLRRWRYLEVGSGVSIGGLDWNGVSNNGSLWVSDQHPTGGPCLVLGYCNQYADGDQWLMMPGEERVLLYLHEFGPRIEEFAPSFSLALWRVIHENVTWGEDEDFEEGE